MTIQVIKTQEQYSEALDQLDSLMAHNFQAGTDESNLLEVLAILIEKYEGEIVDLGPTDPIEAIKFRLDQEGKSNRDLIPVIGNASKVSEVMRGKRPLSLKMIRALHSSFGIPYNSLLAEPIGSSESEIDWSAFPLKEMWARQMFPQHERLSDVKEYAEESMVGFFGDRVAMAYHAFSHIDVAQSSAAEAAQPALHKASTRSGRAMNKAALAVWHTLSLKKADDLETESDFQLHALDDELFEELATLSKFEEGPLLAQELLSKKGVRVVHVPHFRKTYLDGAALKLESGNPVISLTGRHDRLDNFWYVLFHELAHIRQHLYSDSLTAIFDDLDVDAIDTIESEADETAMNCLVSPHIEEELLTIKDSTSMRSFAREYNRSPAIFAGFVRRQKSNYRIFNGLIGRKEVSKIFGR